MTDNRPDGPIERGRFPDKLGARVVSPGYPARLHGYAIEEDLARHYTFTETLYLALTGDLPSETQGRLFDLALTFSSITTIAEAPAHAASLVRICGSQPGAVLGVGALGLAEQARWILERHAPLLPWLEEPTAAFPDLPCAPEAGDRRRQQALEEALRKRGLQARTLPPGPCWLASLLALLWQAGLSKPWQMEAALVVARLGLVQAESHAVSPRAVRNYPMNLPAFDYVREAP